MKKLALSHTPAPRLRRRKPARRAFTLMEIVIVIALIGGLMIFLLPQLAETFGGAQESSEKMKIQSAISTAIMRYKLDMGSYPTTDEGLQVLISAPGERADKWKGPYLEKAKDLEDTWGRPYQYQCPGTHNPRKFDVWSLGPKDFPKEIGNWE
jgi:general secretion pathway protein G